MSEKKHGRIQMLVSECVQSRPLRDACWGSLPVVEGYAGFALRGREAAPTGKDAVTWLRLLRRERWGGWNAESPQGAAAIAGCSWYLRWPHPLATSAEITTWPQNPTTPA